LVKSEGDMFFYISLKLIYIQVLGYTFISFLVFSCPFL